MCCMLHAVVAPLSHLHCSKRLLAHRMCQKDQHTTPKLQTHHAFHEPYQQSCREDSL